MIVIIARMYFYIPSPWIFQASFGQSLLYLNQWFGIFNFINACLWHSVWIVMVMMVAVTAHLCCGGGVLKRPTKYSRKP